MGIPKSSGFGLIFAATCFFITIVLWPLLMGGEAVDTGASAAQRAAHLLAEKHVYLSLWTLEAFGMGVLAASAFVLGFRGPDKVGTPIGWGLVGVGSLANIGMYSFVMGSYFVAATVAADNPVPYEIAKAAAFANFNISNGIAFLGFGLVALSFVFGKDRMLPIWLSAIGALTAFVTVGAAAYALLTTEDIMMFMAPGALVGYILLGAIGVRIVIARD